ncbi:MAG: type II toxin-antitoxin system RelE/ParE family toxin [Spirochaetaceae bacterium]|nr:type II toxin-antitoxin system RelE/ParE family toxin [Spirochaetaceae bacterium]
MRLAYTDSAMNTFLSLDRTVQKRVKKYMDEVQALDDPRSRGHALTGELSGLWRYRVGDWRIICKIKDTELIILVVDLGHRRSIYR